MRPFERLKEGWEEIPSEVVSRSDVQTIWAAAGAGDFKAVADALFEAGLQDAEKEDGSVDLADFFIASFPDDMLGERTRMWLKANRPWIWHPGEPREGVLEWNPKMEGDMGDKHLARHIVATMAQMTGRRYQELWNAVEELPTPALMDLNRFLRDIGDEMQREKRTFRPFPGGPRIRG